MTDPITRTEDTPSKRDVPVAVTVKPVLTLIASHVSGDQQKFKEAAIEIARELQLNGKQELADYIGAQFDLVRTFTIND
jgi:hypothetical protein